MGFGRSDELRGVEFVRATFAAVRTEAERRS